jgi:hypothetical protein
MRMLALLLLVGGCAAPEPSGPTREAEALQRDLAGRTAGSPQSCIPASNSAQSLRTVDARTIVYETGRALWVNRLDSDCLGMRPMDALIVDVHGSQYCRGDRFRPVSTGNMIPGPTCVLGDFTPYRKPG